MKPHSRFLSLVVVLGAFVLASGLGTAAGSEARQSAGKEIDPALVQRLKERARGSVTISTKRATKHASFVRVGQNGDLLPNVQAAPEAKAQDFLSEFGALFGQEGADSQLVQVTRSEDRSGATHVTYRQVYRGVPVFGAMVRAHFDADNNLTAVNGVAVPELSLEVTPKLSAADAAQRAVAHVATYEPEVSDSNLTPAELQAASTTLYVYRIGLVRGAPGTSQLVYEVEVTGKGVREFVYVHAHAGKVVNRYSGIDAALFRRLFEMNTTNQVWQEGDPFPGALNQDQQNIVNFSGDSYRFFFNAFGRDSYDGAGAEMQSVNNDPRIACPNANWNGITTNYCNGVTGDDTVAHEWGHAYTEYTHNLIYQWQPGALNESYSDIWGEVVDELNGPNEPNTVRSVGACTTHTTPVPVLIINSPASIAGECAAAGAAFGPQLTATGLTDNVVLALDDANPTGPSTTDGCTAITNGAQLAGNFALIDRGTCAFAIKTKNAQNAGAVGVVIANNIPGAPSPMAGADPTITISTVMISLAHGNLIKGALTEGQTVNVTMRLGGGVREDSFRWLSGEDDPAFGGAIRDMWNPRCLGDPGKVTDSEYHCATTDNGGVHTNSGVPNHGFALLVDGGTYNGHTVAAIGWTKAAHLYWRAQSVYQTPTSDFDDHADALETSCQDLIGQPLEGLSTGDPAGPSGESISAADCAAVTEMIAAVELRTDPAPQCNFQPILKQNPPDLCATNRKPKVIFQERFERRIPRSWSLSNQGVFSGWPGLDWQHDDSLPGGRRGGAAFAVDPDEGNCDGGAGDISGVMRLASPEIRLPRNERLSPRLTFEHYIATEFQFDGGNVKISINGGDWLVIPASAYLFNPYNTVLQPTNPLATQPGFSGTDGGQVTGSWGQSQIDLTLLGVKPGDRIRLRFDFGMDGCAGIDGWYVDDVKVVACRLREDDSAEVQQLARRD